MALTIPARYQINEETFLHRARGILRQFEASEFEPSPMLTDEAQQSAVLALENTCEQVQAPLQKIEHSLHIPVQFFIVPVFALANAGVPLSLGQIDGAGISVGLGILLGLIVGKPIGLFVASWLAVKANLAELPSGISWAHMGGAGILAGIGFTMSLFIAALGFGEGSAFLNVAKLAILLASVLAGVVGYVVLRRVESKAPVQVIVSDPLEGAGGQIE